MHHGASAYKSGQNHRHTDTPNSYRYPIESLTYKLITLMIRPISPKPALAILAFCAITATSGATVTEPSLRPISVSPSNDHPFTAPLEEVGFVFDRCIKLYDDASVTVRCDGEVVATAISLDVDNYEGETRRQGTLIARFDRQNLPKGKTYTLCLTQGSVGWVERYNDIQVVNMAYTYNVDVPDNLGAPYCEIKYSSTVKDSDSYALQLQYSYEIAPIGNPAFLFYRDGELIGEIPADVSWDWNLGQVSPRFPEKTNFDFGVRYSLVLPAGSVSALHRSDIVNDEYDLSFVGHYQPSDAPLTYSWCSLFSDHTDVLDEVSFTYSSPVGITEGAVIELYEGDCETLVKTAPAYLNTDVNCCLVCCDFGGFKMTSEKGYTIVVPDDAVYLLLHPDIKAAGGKIKVFGSAGIDPIHISRDNSSDHSPLYDLSGRRVTHPIPGTLYIKNGAKFIHPHR